MGEMGRWEMRTIYHIYGEIASNVIATPLAWCENISRRRNAAVDWVIHVNLISFWHLVVLYPSYRFRRNYFIIP